MKIPDYSQRDHRGDPLGPPPILWWIGLGLLVEGVIAALVVFVLWIAGWL